MHETMIPTNLPAPLCADAERSERSSVEHSSVYFLAACLVVVAMAWFLLKELAPLMRPLILAVFVAYIVVPIHRWLKSRISSTASLFVIVGGTLILFWGLALLVFGSLAELNADLPRLIDRARSIVAEFRAYGRAHLPPWLVDSSPATSEAETQGWNLVRAYMRSLLSATAVTLAEALVVGVYLVFLLLEVRWVPHRIRAGFESPRSESILNAVGRINAAMTGYLRAKVVTSLVTAVPTALVLWLFGVRFPLMWGVLTFLGNFIPYVGGLVAFTLPVLLAFLDLDPVWRPFGVALVLILIQVVTNNFVEPTVTGKAVDLSPFVTLVSLTFWGLCWGLTGMLMAVPLTAMLKIIAESVSDTRPLAILMGGSDEPHPGGGRYG
jgi:AI-2 transport protein TqsA